MPRPSGRTDGRVINHIACTAGSAKNRQASLGYRSRKRRGGRRGTRPAAAAIVTGRYKYGRLAGTCATGNPLLWPLHRPRIPGRPRQGHTAPRTPKLPRRRQTDPLHLPRIHELPPQPRPRPQPIVPPRRQHKLVQIDEMVVALFPVGIAGEVAVAGQDVVDQRLPAPGPAPPADSCHHSAAGRSGCC